MLVHFLVFWVSTSYGTKLRRVFLTFLWEGAGPARSKNVQRFWPKRSRDSETNCRASFAIHRRRQRQSVALRSSGETEELKRVGRHSIVNVFFFPLRFFKTKSQSLHLQQLAATSLKHARHLIELLDNMANWRSEVWIWGDVPS